MGQLYSPSVSHDERLACGRGMTDCEIAGISGWCGDECPVNLAGECEEEEVKLYPRGERRNTCRQQS